MPEEKETEEFVIPDQPPDLSSPPEDKPGEVEEIAQAMGWNPGFKGEGAKTAREFILHGQDMLKTSSKHSKALTRKIERMEVKQTEIGETIEKHFRNLRDADKAKFDKKIADLEAKMEEAVEDGDTQEYRKTRTELKKVEEQARKTAEPEEAKPTADPAWDEARADWLESNSWFGVDKEMSNTAEIVYSENKNKGLPPKRFFKFLDNQMKALYPDKFEVKEVKKPKTVADPTPTAKSNKKTKTWSDLSTDEKRMAEETCNLTGMSRKQFLQDLADMEG
ncbi:MAG: hypothetical protein GY841_16175 [FCB group bacterium]|nr:hypothetical protein [FCB group bacterium]